MVPCSWILEAESNIASLNALGKAARPARNLNRGSLKRAAYCKSNLFRYHTVPHDSTLYSTLLYDTILYYTLLYYTNLYYTILYFAVVYQATLWNAVLYYTIPLGRVGSFHCSGPYPLQEHLKHGPLLYERNPKRVGRSRFHRMHIAK